MTVEVALWLLGASVISLLGTGIKMWLMLRECHVMTKKLLEMHENPDNTGFGTSGLASIIMDNTRAIKALIHYVKWTAERQFGETPPPPIEMP